MRNGNPYFVFRIFASGLYSSEEWPELERLMTEAAKIGNVSPEYIMEMAQAMSVASKETMRSALQAIVNCMKGNDMTPLEIAEKAYEKYAEALSFQLGGTQTIKWEDLDLISKTAFLSFSEESIRLHGAHWERPANIDGRNLDMGQGAASADEIPF